MSECSYKFEELKIEIAGMSDGCFFGEAFLVDAGPDYPGEFYVESIKLGSGARLYRQDNRASSGAFETELFKRLAKVIENDWHADEVFNQSDDAPADPAVYSTMNKRTLGLEKVSGANLEVR